MKRRGEEILFSVHVIWEFYQGGKMDEKESAYSESIGSETSSVYFTANEDVAAGEIFTNFGSRNTLRSISREDGNSIEPECRVTLSDDGVTTEKIDSPRLVEMIYTLNDCIWCTNLFVKEREEEGKTKRKGCCSRRRKYYYSSDDVCKEISFIESVLEKLLENLWLMAIKIDPSLPIRSETGQIFYPWKKSSENGELHHVSEAEKMSVLSKIKKSGKKYPNGIIKSTSTNGSVDKKVTVVRFTPDSKEGDNVELEHLIAKKEKDDGESEENHNESTAVTVNDGSNVAVEKDDADTIPNGEVLRCSTRIPLILLELKEIDWRVDIYKKNIEITDKIRIGNNLLKIVSNDGAFDEAIKTMNESLKDRMNRMPKGLQITRYRKIMCCAGSSFNPFKVTYIDSLLFEKERWRIETIMKNGGDPLDHLCGISLPIEYDSFKNDTRATYYGIKRKNLLSISLQTADMSESIVNSIYKKIFSFCMLLLSITLYFSDMVSDVILAGDHYSNGNKTYAALTITFVIAPFMADTMSKLILKALGWDKEYGKLKWRDVFSFNDFKIMRWMASSVNYSLNTMKDYRTFASCYDELHSYRCFKGKREPPFLETPDEEKEVTSNYIHRIFSSMLAWNERFTLQTKLAESLNESAPQLLLQLIIIIHQLNAGDHIGIKSWICIVTSILSLSWSIHLSHFNRHYHTGGRVLNNSYEWSGRIMEFIGNCFVYGSRLTAICLVTSALGVWSVVGALVYLVAIYFIMITFSGRKEIYKTLHRYKTTIFWPFHRLFTVPYRIGIWRMDSVDHLLFYMEIICLAISLPFLLPMEFSKNWIVAGGVLLFEVVGIVILFIFKRFFHPYGYVCENR